MDKTRAAMKDLYSRILVAIRSAESISKRIEKLRDEELQPQILELLQGYAPMACKNNDKSQINKFSFYTLLSYYIFLYIFTSFYKSHHKSFVLKVAVNYFADLPFFQPYENLGSYVGIS